MSDIVNETRFERYLRFFMRFLILVGSMGVIVLLFLWRIELSKVKSIKDEISKTQYYPATDQGDITFSTSSTKIKLAFTGDQGLTNDTKRSLTMIRREGAEALVVLGDFDYQDKPQTWKSMLDVYLGKNFPVIPVVGNHEENAWTGYSTVIQEKISQLPKDMCNFATTSDMGLHYTCILGPVSLVMSAPDIQVSQAKKIDSVSFMKKELAKTDTAWRLCAWHKPHRGMQLGALRDNISWDLYTTCQSAGAYMLMGHDHTYARTKTMLDFPKRIYSTSTSEDVVILGKGSSGAVIAGLGGRGLHSRKVETGPWWSSVYSAENLKIETRGKRKNIAGVLFCTFEKDKKEAPCYFKMTDGQIKDTFTLKRQ